MANNTNTTGRRIPDANILIVDRWNSMTDSKRKQIETIFESINNEYPESDRQKAKNEFIKRLREQNLISSIERLCTDDKMFGFKIPDDKHRLLYKLLGETGFYCHHDGSIDWVCLYL